MTLSGREIRSLCCPIHPGTSLTSETDLPLSVPWPEGILACPNGCRFPTINGLPRFLVRQNYAQAFGLQWRRYQRTQLDSYTGLPISLKRLESALGSDLSVVKGKSVLECGAGAGRFSELLISRAASLICLDMSDAVEANLRNCSHLGQYVLLQADIAAMPVPERAFDIVICLGVLQHTASPEESIRHLAARVKPGGILLIDHYAKRPFLGAAGQYLTLAWPIRAILKRLNPELGLRATIRLSRICDPVRKVTCHFPWLDFFVSRILPTACYYRAFPGLPETIVKEWNELDTHDGLTDWYKHLRSAKQIEQSLIDVGLEVLACGPGPNGIVARARRPVENR